jgi:ABC-2 type transport system ATP-binding protein
MIEVQGLGKSYGEVHAVQDLTFTVRPGQVTGFLGPNGSGKSTTMRMMVGLDTPSSGRALVNGRRYAQLRFPLHDVGALLDPNAVHPGRSARNHLNWLADSNAIPRRRVDEVLATVGLSDVAHRRAGQFSLGMSQRLGIGSALLGDPGVLILDEPINGLDPEGILWVRTLLRRLAAEGRTVLVSSHLMSEMALTADHLIVIGRGRLLATGSIADFIERSSGHQVHVVTANGADSAALGGLVTAQGGTVQADGADALTISGMEARAVGTIAFAAGLAVYELSTHHASLEDAFLDITHEQVDFEASSHVPAAAS